MKKIENVSLSKNINFPKTKINFSWILCQKSKLFALTKYDQTIKKISILYKHIKNDRSLVSFTFLGYNSLLANFFKIFNRSQKRIILHRDLLETVHDEKQDFRHPPPSSLHFTFGSDLFPLVSLFSLFGNPETPSHKYEIYVFF